MSILKNVKRKNTRIRLLDKSTSYSDKIFDKCNLLLMLLLFVIFSWPLWFVLIASFSDPSLVTTGEVLLIPKGLTFKSYKAAIEYSKLWTGYMNTIFVTLVGTTLNLIMSVCLAYPLAQSDFMPKKIVFYMVLITMYFGGGLIPTYLVVKSVGLLDNRWAMIIPGLIAPYNAFIIRTYFMSSIPKELHEASKLDGANSAQYLIRVVLPLSKPVLAVVGLYYAVAHWNSYQSALYYIYDEKKYPLQSVLRELLMSTKMMQDQIAMDYESVAEAMEMANTMKYSVIILACLPMLCVYPFIQRFFVKGVMVGSLKG